jgi:hypothetical protein
MLFFSGPFEWQVGYECLQRSGGDISCNVRDERHYSHESLVKIRAIGPYLRLNFRWQNLQT